MSELKPRITENGIDYILVGDYYIPDLKLPEEHRRIVDISCRPERTGTGTVRHHHGADESYRGRDRGIKAHFSNGMGAALQ